MVKKKIIAFNIVLPLFAAVMGLSAVSMSMAEPRPADATFVCPAGTECPYDSNGNFIGYKNPWPGQQGACQYIIPGLPMSESGKTVQGGVKVYNPTDLRSSTTAPVCRNEPVPPYRVTYHERGHRMRNVGSYIDKNGCAKKFRADGSFIGNECFPVAGSSTQGSAVYDTAVQQSGNNGTNLGIAPRGVEQKDIRYIGPPITPETVLPGKTWSVQYEQTIRTEPIEPIESQEFEEYRSPDGLQYYLVPKR